MIYVIAYDVEDDRARGRLAAKLSHYGTRLQYSVFECMLEPDELERLIADAAGLLVGGSDRLLVLPQCERCRAGRRTIGPADDILAQLFYVV